MKPANGSRGQRGLEESPILLGYRSPPGLPRVGRGRRLATEPDFGPCSFAWFDTMLFCAAQSHSELLQDGMIRWTLESWAAAAKAAEMACGIRHRTSHGECRYGQQKIAATTASQNARGSMVSQPSRTTRAAQRRQARFTNGNGRRV